MGLLGMKAVYAKKTTSETDLYADHARKVKIQARIQFGVRLDPQILWWNLDITMMRTLRLFFDVFLQIPVQTLPTASLSVPKGTRAGLVETVQEVIIVRKVFANCVRLVMRQNGS